MLEVEAAVGQLAEAVAEVLVDRAGEDQLVEVDLVRHVLDNRCQHQGQVFWSSMFSNMRV